MVSAVFGLLVERSFFRREYLKSGYSLKVLNYDSNPYVSSANICELLGWPSDTLLQKLESKGIQFLTLVLKRDENTALFNQMAGFEVPGVKVKQLLVPQMTFFHLRNVNDLLNLFECTMKRIRQEVTAIVESFDPKSAYWLSLSDDSDSEDTASVEGELRKLGVRR